MRQRRFLLYAVAFVMAFLMMGTSAWADIVLPISVSGQVWRVYGDMGNAPIAAPALSGTSTVSVPVLDQTEMSFSASEVDWSVFGTGTLQDFLNSGGGVTGQTSVLGASDPMSNCSLSSFSSSTSCYSTVIELTGTYTFQAGTTYTLSHDDGVILFAGGGSTNMLPAGSEDPTTDIPSSWTPGSNVSGAFTIWYMATNGNPEVLQLTASTVPDGGATLMLLGAALFGLETLRRKFRV